MPPHVDVQVDRVMAQKVEHAGDLFKQYIDLDVPRYSYECPGRCELLCSFVKLLC